MIYPHRPLSTEEKNILIRFDVWTRSLFGGLLRPWLLNEVFSARVHPDIRGNLLIDNGRMLLVPPCDLTLEWKVHGLQGTETVSDIVLEQVLIKAMNQALLRHFINRY